MPPDDEMTEGPGYRLEASGVSATVRPDAGGRLASLAIDGHELLMTSDQDEFSWGAFVMAPFAGRVREATLVYEDRNWPMRPNWGRHAIHGLVTRRRWAQVGRAEWTTQFTGPAPYVGSITERLSLSASSLRWDLELLLTRRAPATIGWHPCFLRRPLDLDAFPAMTRQENTAALTFEASSMYDTEEAGIPDGALVSPSDGPWDDCFIGVRQPIVLRWPELLELSITSTCDHWVIYTKDREVICVEPQTGPPDGVNINPTILEAGQPLAAHMEWHWRRLNGSADDAYAPW
jgi:aldose 1-epimerase